jgi:glycosyltransferase involved in cell wall biosynthesis
MTLAVVVPAHNAASVVPRTVPVMLAQQAPARWVFVDDGSTDGTGDAIEQAIGAADLPEGALAGVRRLPENRGRAAARNAGVRASGESDVVVMLDVDAAPAPGFLRDHVAAYRGGAVAAVARLHYADADLSEPYGRYLNSALRGPGGFGSDDAVPWRHFVTTACSVRRAAFDAVGGFDERVTYGEDLDLAGRLAVQHPRGLRVAGQASIYDHRDLAGTLRVLREFAGRNLPSMVRKNPGLLRLARLEALVGGAPHHRLARRVLPTAARLVRAALPAIPERLVPLAVRLILAGAVTDAFLASGYSPDRPRSTRP